VVALTPSVCTRAAVAPAVLTALSHPLVVFLLCLKYALIASSGSFGGFIWRLSFFS